MIRLTHVGGPTTLIELVDARGRRHSFGWGAFSRKLAGPAIGPGELGRIDAAGRALLPRAGPVTTRAGAARVPPWTARPALRLR